MVEYTVQFVGESAETERAQINCKGKGCLGVLSMLIPSEDSVYKDILDLDLKLLKLKMEDYDRNDSPYLAWMKRKIIEGSVDNFNNTLHSCKFFYSLQKGATTQ